MITKQLQKIWRDTYIMNNFWKMKRVAAVSMTLLIAASTFAYDKVQTITSSAEEDSQPYSQKLDDLQKEQDRLDNEIADAEQQISKEKDNLDAINKKYDALQKKIKSTEKSSAELEDQMVELDTKMRDTMHNLEEQNAAIEVMKSDFMARIRTMYIAGGTESYTNVLIDSEDFFDVLMRVELVKRVAKHDNDELKKLMDKKAEIEKIQAELDKQSENLKTASKEYASKQKELAQQQAEILKMQKESGAKLEKLQNDKNDLAAQSQKVLEEYSKISEQAKQTASSTAKNPEKSTTTKKASNSNPEKNTTTKKQETQKPSENNNDSNHEKTTTKAPETTTKPPVTTASPSDDENSSKADIVVNYAKSMVGGSYVWAGERFGATDCSGLIMLSYRQIGISLPHYAASQANYGSVISYSNMQPGDVIFFGGSSYSSIYHVAMYIGGGKMVHAENSYTGIVISNVASFSQYNNITVIKRLL